MNFKKTLQNVISLSKEAGSFIRKESLQFNKSKVEYKSFNSLVSYVDKEAEKFLVKGLKKHLPDSGFITEEETEKQQHMEYTWIIDPLDGTTNFIHGIPCFCISIGLMKKNKVILGVVYEINLDECFYAMEGENAFCNGKKITVSKVSKLSESLVATGFPYETFTVIDDYVEILKGFMKYSHGVRRLGSAAVDLAYVACGRFEGFYEYNLNSWDVAAGSFIVKQAGGKVTDFSGNNNYIFGKEIIASGNVHKNMMDIIKKYYKSSGLRGNKGVMVRRKINN